MKKPQIFRNQLSHCLPMHSYFWPEREVGKIIKNITFEITLDIAKKPDFENRNV